MCSYKFLPSSLLSAHFKHSMVSKSEIFTSVDCIEGKWSLKKNIRIFSVCAHIVKKSWKPRRKKKIEQFRLLPFCHPALLQQRVCENCLSVNKRKNFPSLHFFFLWFFFYQRAKKLIVKAIMPFHLIFFLAFYTQLMARKFICTRLLTTYNISGGFEMLLLFLRCFCTQPPLIYQFLLCFFKKIYFIEKGWGKSKSITNNYLITMVIKRLWALLYI